MSQRRPLRLELPRHLADHRYLGAAVLPAVEALQALAREASALRPDLDVTRSVDARFRRFLPVNPSAGAVDAFAEFEPLDGGALRATLLTVKTAGKSGIRRSLEHVAVTFGVDSGEAPRAEDEPDDPPFVVTPEQLYGTLVPFGPAFQNTSADAELWSDQARAEVTCPGLPGGDGPLGSPFPLDAALHVACAWAQRQLGVVLFPVGYGERRIVRPTEPGGSYRCQVLPLAGDSPHGARFDITLSDADGAPREICRGVMMDDVSRGELTPPMWIRP